MSRRALLTAALAALALLAPAIALAQTAGHDVETRVTALYTDAYRLAKRGIDVSTVIHELDKALKLARRGDVEEAQRLLDDASARLQQLESGASSTLLRARLEKFLAVAVLAAIPVATYLLLPRLYLRLWYKSRRRWVVEH